MSRSESSDSSMAPGGGRLRGGRSSAFPISSALLRFLMVTVTGSAGERGEGCPLVVEESVATACSVGGGEGGLTLIVLAKGAYNLSMDGSDREAMEAARNS